MSGVDVVPIAYNRVNVYIQNPFSDRVIKIFTQASTQKEFRSTLHRRTIFCIASEQLEAFKY